MTYNIEISLRDTILAFECIRDSRVKCEQIASNVWSTNDEEIRDEILEICHINKIEHLVVINF